MERWSLTSKVVSGRSRRRRGRREPGRRRSREDVDDPAAHRQLATVLDLVLTPVALPDQLGDEFLGVDALALDQGDRGGGVAPGPSRWRMARTGRRRRRGASHLGEEVPQHESLVPMVATSGSPARREGLPRREDHDPLAQPTGRRGVGLVRVRKHERSPASRSASANVAVTTTRGRRSESPSSPAMTKGWAGPLTARVASGSR